MVRMNYTCISFTTCMCVVPPVVGTVPPTGVIEQERVPTEGKQIFVHIRVLL